MVMRRMMMMMLMMMMVVMLREETRQAYGESSLRGRGGSLSPGRSRIRGPARPFASQSKTQSNPLGGYLSCKGLV